MNSRLGLLAASLLAGCQGGEGGSGWARHLALEAHEELGFLADTGEPVMFQAVDGLALADDIVLGPVDEVRRSGVRRIVVVDAQRPRIAFDGRVGVTLATRWPQGIIPVEFALGFPSDRRAMVEFSLAALERRTALRFPARTTEPDSVTVSNGASCWSNIGQVGGSQVLSLGPGCGSPGVTMHEFMHTAGWTHEQCRTDRDQHVIYHPENVRPAFGFNFDVLAVEDDDHLGPYDFDSVMHYGAFDFSDAGGVVLEPRDASVPLSRLGQRCGPSLLDLASINATYSGMPRGGLEVGLSATELHQLPHELGKTVVIDVGEPLLGAELSVQSSERSIVETAEPPGLALVDQCRGLLTVRISGQPRSGSCTLTFRLTTASGTFTERSLTYVVDGSATNAPTPFSTQNYYYYGDRVTFAGRVYMNVTLRDVGRGYEVWSNQRTGGFTCAPTTCTSTSPASYASIRLHWIEAPSGAAAPSVIARWGVATEADGGRGDAGEPLDAGGSADGGAPVRADAGEAVVDAGIGDAGTEARVDAGESVDAGLAADAGESSRNDGGAPVVDAGIAMDGGEAPNPDAAPGPGAGRDAGRLESPPPRGVEPVIGSACSSAPSLAVMLTALLLLRSRK